MSYISEFANEEEILKNYFAAVSEDQRNKILWSVYKLNDTSASALEDVLKLIRSGGAVSQEDIRVWLAPKPLMEAAVKEKEPGLPPASASENKEEVDDGVVDIEDEIRALSSQSAEVSNAVDDALLLNWEVFPIVYANSTPLGSLPRLQQMLLDNPGDTLYDVTYQLLFGSTYWVR